MTHIFLNHVFTLQALAILDCLTSPKDIDDPQFSIEKDSRRETLLQLNDYSVLKVAITAIKIFLTFKNYSISERTKASRIANVRR